MDMFSSSPLMESFTSRFSSPDPSPTRTEMDLPIEVDQSFNSSLSLSCAGDASPTPCAAQLSFSPTMNYKSLPSLPIPTRSADFLSPIPTELMSRPQRPGPVPIQAKYRDEPPTDSLGFRPFGAGRAFGRELSSNNTMQRSGPPPAQTSKGKMLPPGLPEGKPSSSKPQSGGVPMQWSTSNDETSLHPRLSYRAALSRGDSENDVLSPQSLPSTSGSEMDVDSPRPSARARSSTVQVSPAFSGSPGLGSFFCESPVPPSALPPAKRRSLVTGSPASPASPSAKRASYGFARNVDKSASSSGMLFGGGGAAAGARTGNPSASRRGVPYKRPPQMAMPASDYAPPDVEAQRSASSAYPILYGGPKPTLNIGATFSKAAPAPMRRAFSVCDQQQMGNTSVETEDDESEYEASPSATIHAEYARRHGQKFVPRVDGSPGFKPMRSSYAATTGVMESPSAKGKRPSPFRSGGLPGFGDNEMDGKILPCHKVKEDGLVRITPDTLEDLIEGKYTAKIKRHHVLDCRFDYEFAGGHIAGAHNVKSMDSLDDLLLASFKGVYASGDPMPVPSRSGELGVGEQVVLVFHCEFSAKRAPTFAKHLRSRDRMLNNNLYPKIFYPEVYILEGGYSRFFKSRPTKCEPQGYVRMDDPKHFERRNSDLHDFRKFARTRSFTYGETQTLHPPLTLAGTSRAPPFCPPLAFAAASAAVGRRQGPTIAEEEHDNDTDSPPQAGHLSGSPGHQATPCPRVVSLGNPPVFGSAKPRQVTRLAFTRVASYAGTGTTVRQ